MRFVSDNLAMAERGNGNAKRRRGCLLMAVAAKGAVFNVIINLTLPEDMGQSMRIALPEMKNGFEPSVGHAWMPSVLDCISALENRC